MKLLHGYIDWKPRYANEPTLQLKVDKLPDFDKLRYEKRESYYFAEYDGFVRFFSYTRPGNGFGGSTYRITLLDETSIDLIGPWSGNAETANRLGFPSCLEVMICDRETMPISGAVTASWLLPQMHLIYTSIHDRDTEAILFRKGNSLTPGVRVQVNDGFLRLTKSNDPTL